MLVEIIIITILIGVALPKPGVLATLYQYWSGALVVIWLLQVLGILGRFTR